RAESVAVEVPVDVHAGGSTVAVEKARATLREDLEAEDGVADEPDAEHGVVRDDQRGVAASGRGGGENEGATRTAAENVEPGKGGPEPRCPRREGEGGRAGRRGGRGRGRGGWHGGRAGRWECRRDDRTAAVAPARPAARTRHTRGIAGLPARRRDDAVAAAGRAVGPCIGATRTARSLEGHAPAARGTDDRPGPSEAPPAVPSAARAGGAECRPLPLRGGDARGLRRNAAPGTHAFDRSRLGEGTRAGEQQHGDRAVGSRHGGPLVRAAVACQGAMRYARVRPTAPRRARVEVRARRPSEGR